MLSLRNISIKNKLIWMQVITSMLVLGICFIAFVVTDIRGYKEREVNHANSIAQVVGNNTVSAIQFLDNAAAVKILSELQEVQEDIVNACVFDKNGNVFADYTTKGNIPYEFHPPFTDKHMFEGNFLYVYKNIIKDNELLGTVCLKVELSQLQQIEKQKLQMAIILLVIGIAVAFLLAILNQRYISKPLLSLVNVMREVGKSGDYNMQVPIEGNDEIALLSIEFNNLMEQVISSHQKKDEFIGVASHELKTPLTTVKGFLELLNSRELADTNKLFVQKALNGANKLQDLIYDLLDVSKIQAGQLELNISEFNIDKLIDECIHETQIGTTTHTITKEGGMVNTAIFADRNRIEQVLINLLSNAIKYSPRGGPIIVNAIRTESKIIISVKDLGIGLPMSELEKIFDRFYRSKQKESGATGFGLGLYICAQIIKRHNGKIWVESEAGYGSTFYFELPVKAALIV
jgi:signal transduction histidine kinase